MLGKTVHRAVAMDEEGRKEGGVRCQVETEKEAINFSHGYCFEHKKR